MSENTGLFYELTDETIEVRGHTLHRIRALKDINEVVHAGDLGGFGGDGPRWVNGSIGTVTRIAGGTVRVELDGEEHEVGLAAAGDGVAQVVAGHPGGSGAGRAAGGGGTKGGGQVHRRPGGLVPGRVGADDPPTGGERGGAAAGRAGADAGELEPAGAVGLGGRGGAGGGRLGTRRGRRG